MSEIILRGRDIIDSASGQVEMTLSIDGILPIVELVGESVTYINNFITKKTDIRLGYQVKIVPYSTNTAGTNSTQTILGVLTSILKKRYIWIRKSDDSFLRWRDGTDFAFSDLTTSGREVICDSVSVSESWESGEEIIELTLKEKGIR